MISTGLQKVDEFLSGGIPYGVIVDIFGANGTGKSGLCYSGLFLVIKHLIHGCYAFINHFLKFFRVVFIFTC